jgi:hypothetical protein
MAARTPADWPRSIGQDYAPPPRRVSLSFTEICVTPAIPKSEQGFAAAPKQRACARRRSWPGWRGVWRAGGGKFKFGAPVATTAAEAALPARAEAAGRSICAALIIV